MDDKKTWHPSSKWLSFFLIAITIIFIFSIYQINDECKNQNKFNATIAKESTQITNPFLQLKPDTKSKKYYLSNEYIQKLNSHVEYLAKKLETEIDRNQRNAEYNIDRLNLFLALGIGFLALIGGLLPLAVNFISKHDIESKLKDIESRAKESEETVKSSEKKMPTVDLLILQSAISKLTSTEMLRLFINQGQYSDIANMIERITTSLKLFEAESFINYSDEHIRQLNEILSELSLALKYGPLTKTSSAPRQLLKKMDEIVVFINANKNGNANNFNTITTGLTAKLSELKSLFTGLVDKP